METYTAKFSVKGMGEVEVDVSKEAYERLSKFCKEKFPDKDWKCEKQ